MLTRRDNRRRSNESGEKLIMSLFYYEALDRNNKIIKDTVEQDDRTKVIDMLTAQGLRPIKIVATKPSALKSMSISLGGKKVKSSELVIFTRQLSVMVGAGVPLIRSLNSLGSHAPKDSPLRSILTEVVKDIEGGATLSEGFAKHPNTFNEVYINMVKAGESAGILDEILNRLAVQQERSASMNRKIRGAMTYPMVLLFVTIASFFGLMIFIIPQIGSIVTELSGEDKPLPGITLVMLGISSFMVSYWYFVLAGIVSLVLAFRYYIKTPSGKKWWNGLILKIPGIGVLVNKIIVARFTRTFSSLMGAGVAVLEALTVTSGAVGNVIYIEALEEVSEKVKNGDILSRAIEETGLFPAIVPQMLAAGEETGQIDTILVKVADYYDEEVDVAVNGISSIIEPVMIVIMGGMVGLVAASVMVPIAQMSQNIKG